MTLSELAPLLFILLIFAPAILVWFKPKWFWVIWTNTKVKMATGKAMATGETEQELMSFLFCLWFILTPIIALYGIFVIGLDWRSGILPILLFPFVLNTTAWCGVFLSLFNRLEKWTFQ